MLSNCISDIEKEVGRHIGLARSLTERNEVLSSKVVYLELQLKERDGELQKERQTVEDHLQVRTKQSAEIERLKNRCEKLEKDMTLMKQTAQETKDSTVVSDFSSAITMNLEKISYLGIENGQLTSTVEILKKNQRNTDKIIEQNNNLMLKEQDQLKIELNMARERERGARLFSEQLSKQTNQLLQLNNNLQNQHKDQLNAHQEELKRLIESYRDELRRKNEEIEEFRSKNEERNTVQLQNLKDSIEQKYYSIDRKVDSMQIRLNTLPGKFVFVSNWSPRDYLASNNVERIDFVEDNLDSLVYSISSYRRELLIWTNWKHMNITSGRAEYYAKLLSFCQEWERLRPDGEIHCLCWYRKGESPSEPSNQLASLLTTYNKYLNTDYTSNVPAIRQYWPKFADSILSEKCKNEYPAKHFHILSSLLRLNIPKFVFVCHLKFVDCLSSENVERINFRVYKLDRLVHDISSYRKELLIFTFPDCLNATSNYADLYAKLLSLCRQWKRLRPDGEIHCLCWYLKSDSLLKPSDEFASLLTTCNKYLNNDSTSRNSAFRQYWPMFADLILSEKIKNKYPI